MVLKKKLAILGAGGFGREIFHLIDKDFYDVVGFIDNLNTSENLPVSIIGGDVIIESLKSKDIAEYLAIAIGDMKARRKLYNLCKDFNIGMPTIIHSSAIILTTSPIGNGTFVYPGAVIMNDCKIGNSVLVNSGVTMGHDVEIGDFSNINPGVHLAGRIKIGEECMIGIGASIRENIKIGNRVIIGAGSVVVKDIPDDTLVYGVPAKNHNIS